MSTPLLPLRRTVYGLVAMSVLALSGCDWLGLESASATASRREAEGKAVGAACRHAGRAIEDCYVLNKRADKAAVFAGWREMNDYMRENKMEAVAPLLSGTGLAKQTPSTIETETAAPGSHSKPSKKDS